MKDLKEKQDLRIAFEIALETVNPKDLNDKNFFEKWLKKKIIMTTRSKICSYVSLFMPILSKISLIKTKLILLN